MSEDRPAARLAKFKPPMVANGTQRSRTFSGVSVRSSCRAHSEIRHAGWPYERRHFSRPRGGTRSGKNAGGRAGGTLLDAINVVWG
jgi:hypothetical protein